MAEWESATRADYESKGFAQRSGFGSRPALLIVDFINGFTDPATPLGGDFSAELEVTRQLQQAFRGAGRPVAYTTVAYQADLKDGGHFIEKVPSLGILTYGSPMIEVDRRISPDPGERVFVKKFASAFFGTDVDDYLKGQNIDTLVLTGCTTSGCIRASAVDSLQYGYRTVVVRDGVGDRADGPHQANLFDIDAKYGDVITGAEVLENLKRLAPGADLASEAAQDFQSWWQAPSARRG